MGKLRPKEGKGAVLGGSTKQQQGLKQVSQLLALPCLPFLTCLT